MDHWCLCVCACRCVQACMHAGWGECGMGGGGVFTSGSGAAQCLDFPTLQEGFIGDFCVTIHTPVSIV